MLKLRIKKLIDTCIEITRNQTLEFININKSIFATIL